MLRPGRDALADPIGDLQRALHTLSSKNAFSGTCDQTDAHDPVFLASGAVALVYGGIEIISLEVPRPSESIDAAAVTQEPSPFLFGRPDPELAPEANDPTKNVKFPHWDMPSYRLVGYRVSVDAVTKALSILKDAMVGSGHDIRAAVAGSSYCLISRHLGPFWDHFDERHAGKVFCFEFDDEQPGAYRFGHIDPVPSS